MLINEKISGSYFKRVKSLRSWLSRSSLSEYEGLLLELGILLQVLYRQERVEVKDKELNDQIKSALPNERSRKLYELLVNGLCLLHQSERMEEEDYWQAERSDQLRALELLQPSYFPKSLISLKDRRIYQCLIEHFYPEDFRMGEAHRALRMSRSTLKNYVKRLEHAGYLERVGGNRKQGYLYNVGTSPWK